MLSASESRTLYSHLPAFAGLSRFAPQHELTPHAFPSARDQLAMLVDTLSICCTLYPCLRIFTYHPGTFSFRGSRLTPQASCLFHTFSTPRRDYVLFRFAKKNVIPGGVPATTDQSQCALRIGFLFLSLPRSGKPGSAGLKTKIPQ